MWLLLHYVPSIVLTYVLLVLWGVRVMMKGYRMFFCYFLETESCSDARLEYSDAILAHFNLCLLGSSDSSASASEYLAL